MPLDCSCGSSFLLRGHLWVVIAELSGSPDQVLVVSLTTKRTDSDTTVILQSGDHDFIKHDTVVNYTDSRIFNKNDLIDRIDKRDFKPDKPFTADKLKIIQQGLLDSAYTPQNMKAFYKKSI